MFYREEEQLRQSLEDTILKPDTISEACKSVRKIIDHHSVGLQFSSEAGCLIDRIFLSVGELPAWLAVVSKPGYERDAASLLNLLHPQGCLLSFLSRLNDNRCFVYPIDRLPLLTRRMLSFSNRRELLLMWPQYHGNVFGKDEPIVELPAMVYYLMSFVRFAAAPPRKREKESNAIAAFFSSFTPKVAKSTEPTYCSLLRSYLEHFMPRGRHRIDDHGGEPGRRPTLPEIFLGIMEEFWLADYLEPVPKGLMVKSVGSALRSKTDVELTSAARSPFRSSPSVMVDSLIQLFEHVDQNWELDSAPQPALHKIRWLPHVQMHTHPVPKGLFLERPFVDTDVGSLAAQALFRRLFRYIWQMLDGWDERSNRSLSGIVDLWMLHACPWKQSKRRSKAVRASAPIAEAADGEFSEKWLPHVLANFPFYNIILPMFLRLNLYRMQHRPDSAVRDMLVVLEKFKHPGFRELLAGLEESLTSYVKSGRRAVGGAHSHLIPFLSIQMQDWTIAAKSGMSTQGLGVLQADFSVFSAGNDGVRSLLQSIMVEADASAKPKYCTALQSIVHHIFGVRMPFRSSEPSSGGSDTPKGMKWNDLSLFDSSPYYDPMHRIPTSYEIHYLAKQAVILSDAINKKFGLPGKPHYVEDIKMQNERDEHAGEEEGWRWEVPQWLEPGPSESWLECRLRGSLRLLLTLVITVCHCLSVAVNDKLLPYVRQKHPRFRVNLRFLADRAHLSAICLGLFLLSSTEFSLASLLIVAVLVGCIAVVPG